MTNSFADFARAKLLLVIGSNMTEAHPVASTFVKDAVLAGAQLIVVDPRRTSLADFAALHVPIKVGSDVAFLNGVMHVLIAEDLYDKDYVASCTTGFDVLKERVLAYPPERAAEISGVGAETIRNVARRLAAVKPAMLIYTLGITEHTCGVNNVLSCANLQMLLGNVGFECGGVNPLRGQNNVQGACDMGALPNVFPGYQQVGNPEARAKFEKAWNVPRLPEKPGLMIPQMIDGLLSGAVKAFYVFGENLANTEPDIRHVEHCLESAEFLVCQDIFPTETTRFAHVVLPAAAWSENDGKFTCGLGVFTPVDWTPPAEVPDAEFPLVLSTGRRLYHYHTRTQTGRSRGITELLGEETADISPADADARGIAHGETICVRSRRGEVAVRANVTEQVPAGMVWMAFHFREACANWLTNPAYDPKTQTAEYKACAVQISRLR